MKGEAMSNASSFESRRWSKPTIGDRRLQYYIWKSHWKTGPKAVDEPPLSKIFLKRSELGLILHRGMKLNTLWKKRATEVRRLVGLAYADLPNKYQQRMALETFSNTLGNAYLQRQTSCWACGKDGHIRRNSPNQNWNKTRNINQRETSRAHSSSALYWLC